MKCQIGRKSKWVKLIRHLVSINRKPKWVKVGRTLRWWKVQMGQNWIDTSLIWSPSGLDRMDTQSWKG